MDDHAVLFIPGPTEVDEELRRIMAMPLLGHRDPRFVEVVQDVCRRLHGLYLTEQHVAFETCPATAMMEAAVRNLVPRGASVLHLVGGAFGARWRKISQACGRRAEAIEVPLGHPHEPAVVADRLRDLPDAAAVCITHNETSTGVLQPLPALCDAIREVRADALILVDAVTSLGGAELRFDAWGLDFAFAGTQKCLALPPGLASYAVSRRALERAADVEDRGYLFDLLRAVAQTNAGKTLATPCVPLVYALRRQLERIEQETLEGRWARHLALRDATLSWAAGAGYAPFVADEAARSPTVSCLDAKGADVDALARRAADAGFKLDKGYGDLKGVAFRIGHMGDHDRERLDRLLAAL